MFYFVLCNFTLMLLNVIEIFNKNKIKYNKNNPNHKIYTSTLTAEHIVTMQKRF